MGYQNASLVRHGWRHLPGMAFRALNEMAWCSRDKDNPPRYWGGPGRLAWAMGRLDKEDGEPSPADLRAVSDVVKQLLEAKAIERQRRSGPGVRAEYVLYLWRGTYEGNPRACTDEENPRALPVDEGPEGSDGAATYEDFPSERTRFSRTNVRGFSGATYEENPRTKEQPGSNRETSREPTSPQVSTSLASSTVDDHPEDPPDPEAERRRQQRELNERIAAGAYDPVT